MANIIIPDNNIVEGVMPSIFFILAGVHANSHGNFANMWQ